jgi:hypothetical protein
MGSTEDAHADAVNIVLHRSSNDLFWPTVKAGVDHFHPGFHKCASNDLYPSIVTVKTHFR